MRRGLILVALLAAALAVTGVSLGSLNVARGANGKTINFLYAAPLTSDSTGSGQAGCNGAKLAVADVNAAGGITKGPEKGAHLSVKCIDDEFTSSVDVTIANQYIADSNTWALMGFLTTGEAQAAAQVVAPYKLAVIASNVSGDPLTRAVHNVVVIPGRLSPIGAAETDFCHAYWGGKKIANINPEFSYVDELEAGEKYQMGKLGMTLVADERYPYGTNDFSSYLTPLQSKKPDCIMEGDFAPTAQQVLVQARGLGIKAPVMDFCACGSAQAGVDLAKNNYVGSIIGEMVPYQRPKGSLIAKVAGEWTTKYHTRLTSYPAWSYDGVMATAAAIEAGASSRTDLLKYMRTVNIPGLTAQLNFKNGLRPPSATLVLLEQTGTTLASVQPVGEYTLSLRGRIKRVFVAKCSKRPTCIKLH